MLDEEEMERGTALFHEFHEQFAALFGRSESRWHSHQYLLGLIVQGCERRNAENVAEAVTGVSDRALQRFLTNAPWSHQAVITALQVYLSHRLTHAEGVFIVDESCFPKQGKESVGVQHQYCGRLGKVANAQQGVFLSYATPRGYALVNMHLYLPPAWISDTQRRERAEVPPDVIYRSKAELGVAMLEQTRQHGWLEGRWVTADEAYGEVPTFRDALDAAHWHYVLEVPKTSPVFVAQVKREIPPWSGRGRKPTKPCLVPGEPKAQTVSEVCAALPAEKWKTLVVGDGAQGPRLYEFAASRVWESRDGVAGRACWLLLRRNLDGSELKFSLSNAPEQTPLLTLARVGATRWCIETNFQMAKGEIGLDEYEVRTWPGWHHHITMALLAGAFLLTMQQEWGKKGAPDYYSPSGPSPEGRPPVSSLVSG